MKRTFKQIHLFTVLCALVSTGNANLLHKFKLEDSNKKYCRDLDELRREKDEMNSKIKTLSEDLDKAQSTSSNQDHEREQLKKQLADEKLKKIQVGMIFKSILYYNT